MSKLCQETIVIHDISSIFNAMNSKTAILIFAQTAPEECKHKYFNKGKELFTALNLQVIKTVEKTAIPYFIFTEKEQVGKSFGERYANAIETIFNKGYSNIITIGNDCPELKPHQLIRAANNCFESKTTVGPALDGGFYLLAFHKNQFDKEAFLKLPWQKKSLRKELIKLLRSKEAVITTLCFYNDLDNLKDINYYLSHKNTIAEGIFNLLQISTIAIPNSTIWDSIKTNFISTSFNKGSPVS